MEWPAPACGSVDNSAPTPPRRRCCRRAECEAPSRPAPHNNHGSPHCSSRRNNDWRGHCCRTDAASSSNGARRSSKYRIRLQLLTLVSAGLPKTRSHLQPGPNPPFKIQILFTNNKIFSKNVLVYFVDLNIVWVLKSRFWINIFKIIPRSDSRST